MSEQQPRKTDFEKLIEEEKADKLRESQALKKQQKGNFERKQKVAGIVVGALAITLVAGIVIYDPFTNALRWGDGPSQVEFTENQTAISNDPYRWAKESGSLFPEKTNSWQETSYLDTVKSNVPSNELQEKYWSTDLQHAAMRLPSEAAGFTSDDDKSVNEDGSLNPMYSYWTQEVFVSESALIIERLLNPAYGGWGNYQYSSFVEINDFSTMKSLFTDIMPSSMFEENDLKNVIPVYADWDRNDYNLGDSLLSIEQGKRWKGVVQNMEVDMVYDNAELQYTANLSIDILYQAWTKDKNILEKNAKLNLVLVANDTKLVDSASKVVIQSANLEIE